MSTRAGSPPFLEVSTRRLASQRPECPRTNVEGIGWCRVRDRQALLSGRESLDRTGCDQQRRPARSRFVQRVWAGSRSPDVLRASVAALGFPFGRGASTSPAGLLSRSWRASRLPACRIQLMAALSLRLVRTLDAVTAPGGRASLALHARPLGDADGGSIGIRVPPSDGLR